MKLTIFMLFVTCGLSFAQLVKGVLNVEPSSSQDVSSSSDSLITIKLKNEELSDPTKTAEPNSIAPENQVVFPYTYNASVNDQGFNAGQFMGYLFMSAGSGMGIDDSYQNQVNYGLASTNHPNVPLQRSMNFRDSVNVGDPQDNSVGTFLVGSVFYWLGSKPWKNK